MAWIESHQGLLNHPKLFDLAQAMGWDIDTCIGKLHRLWWWCVDYAEDGDLRRHNDGRIAMAMGVATPDAKRLVEAMVEACWLDRQPYFRVHDWWDYAGNYLQGRYKRTPERWQEIRAKYVTNAVDTPDCSGYVRGTARDTNLPDQPNQPDRTNRTAREGPPTPKMLVEHEVTLDVFLRLWWGQREGNVSAAVMHRFLELSRLHGYAALGEAIIKSANANVRSLRYVEGILRPKQSERPVDTGPRENRTPTAVGSIATKALTTVCESHPDVTIATGALCPKCFPKCKKCQEQHLPDENCEEWKQRLPGVKQSLGA